MPGEILQREPARSLPDEIERPGAGLRPLPAYLQQRTTIAGSCPTHYGDLTGAPDESGNKRREKGFARTGNARV
jgi:hypothetical protein